MFCSSSEKTEKPDKKEEDVKWWLTFGSETKSLPVTATQAQTQISTTQKQGEPDDDNKKEDEEGKISFYVKVGKHTKFKYY